MEIKWLEDFVLLAQIKNFSKTAEMRNVTQPAFSRRIQALETWLGVSLIDRSTFPTALTGSGEVFLEQAVKPLEQIRETRTLLKGQGTSTHPIIDFAVPHNLSLTFFPDWLLSVSDVMEDASYRLRALNVHDAVMTLLNGGCDLLMAYYHPSQALQIDAEHYEMVVLGVETIAPYSLVNTDGRPMFEISTQALEASSKTPFDEGTPFLAYTNNAYLGKIVEFILSKHAASVPLKTVYETDMAEGLKSMMMSGHGFAFLPESSVKTELESGLVTKACTADHAQFELELEIRLYREAPHAAQSNKSAAKNGDKLIVQHKTAIMNQFWQSLQPRMHRMKLESFAQVHANYA